MRTDKQLKELYETDIILKNNKFYYVTVYNTPTGEEIMNANDISMAFSEWWEVYHSRASILKEQGILFGIPIISEEDFFQMID